MATKTTYKVWIEVEECRLEIENGAIVNDDYLDIDVPFGACFEADTAEQAVAFATRLNELADQLPRAACGESKE